MTTINPAVGASGNDGKSGIFWGGGDLNIEDATLWIGNRIDGQRDDYSIILRFVNVTIPQGATINSATITLRGEETDSTSGLAATIWGVDADNPSFPADYDAAEALTHTTATASWSNPAVTAGSNINTPSISTIVKEIVDRAGWASGQAMILVIENNGSSAGVYRSFHSYDSNASYAPVLNVDYSSGGTAYTLAADVGSFTLTGVDAALTKALKMGADVGSFSLTGIDAALHIGRKLTAAVGTFTLTGIDANLTKALHLTADVGSYTLTGIDAGLYRAIVMTADGASFTLTGNDAALTRALKLLAETGSYALTGYDATLTANISDPYTHYTLTADMGAFVLTGIDAGFTKALHLTADPGAFTLTGIDAGLLRGLHLIADPSAYSLTGNDANFTKALRMAADGGIFTLTGYDAALRLLGAYIGIVPLTLFMRGTSMTLDPRFTSLTLHTRGGLTLDDRDNDLTLHTRTNALTMEGR